MCVCVCVWSLSVSLRVASRAGSPAETLRAGDEILSVNGHSVADMSCAEWGASMEHALQQGSLTMDVRRHGGTSESTPRSVCVGRVRVRGRVCVRVLMC